MERKGNREKSDVRQKILSVAANLMIEKGVKETSLKDIANEVGISKGTLYYYYSAKDDIIFDITDQHLNQITEEFTSWIENIDEIITPEEELKIFFEKILNAETRDKLHLYLMSDAVLSSDSVRKKFMQRYEEWRHSIEYWLKKAMIHKKTDFKVLSYLTLAALDGLIMQKLVGGEDHPIPVAEIAKILADVK